MAQRQINVRLDEDEYRQFVAVSFIEGRSLSDELRAAVRAYIEGFEDNPNFKQALAAQRGRELEREGDRPKVSSLDDKRKRTRRPDA